MAAPRHTPTAFGPVPEGATSGGGCAAPGAQLRKLVAAALAQRQRALRCNYSRAPQAGLVAPMARLQQWLATNPHPSPATVRAFPLVGDVQLVALGNAAGRKLLHQLHQLTHEPLPTT